MSKVKFGGKEMRLPRSRIARLGIGGLLVVFGVLGFLPILGFWMIPLGLMVLSVDVPAIRRIRRRFEVWAVRRWRGRAPGDTPEGDPVDLPRR